jgi:uncharacterized protein (UPF0262 family)
VPEAKLAELRIAEDTWSRGTAARKSEWRLAVSEVVQEGVFEVPAGAGAGAFTALIEVDDAAARLRVSLGGGGGGGGGGEVVEELPLATLKPLADEYMQVCVEMGRLGEGANSPKLEALDVAKRLVHDEAGDTVRSLLRTARPDHATARRLFTLLVTLLYDTTKLAAPTHAV